MKYFNSNDKIVKIEKDDLSIFLEDITFKVNSVGVWSSPLKKIANYTINDIEFIFYTKGGGTTTINGKDYACNVNDFMVLEPYHLYTSTNDGKCEVEYQYIHFDIEPAIYQAKFLAYFKNHVYTLRQCTRVINLFNLIRGEATYQKDGCLSSINAYLKVLFIELYRDQPLLLKTNQNPSFANAQNQLVSSSISYINKNLKNDCSIKAIAMQFDVSENYLYKAFVNTLNETPSSYISKIRINRAKALLTTSLLSIDEIAEEIGFSNIATFSRSFKNKEKVSPSDYRKLQKATKKME